MKGIIYVREEVEIFHVLTKIGKRWKRMKISMVKTVEVRYSGRN